MVAQHTQRTTTRTIEVYFGSISLGFRSYAHPTRLVFFNGISTPWILGWVHGVRPYLLNFLLQSDLKTKCILFTFTSSKCPETQDRPPY